MRLLALVFAFFLPITCAYADSSCDPVSNAYLALTKIPDFTVYEASIRTLLQIKIEIQGRSDGIYEQDRDKDDAVSFVKKQDRDEFTEEAKDHVKDRWADSERKCTLNTEDVINGKAMLVYLDGENRIWIGKDDGLFYQILADSKLYTLVYGLQK